MKAADLHIGRVVLRGSAPAIERARATLPAALARAHWPADEAIVVVRRVAVGGTATELPARAAAATEQLARRAADPWSPAADSADAVRFRDALDYRACLVRDLLAGTAARRWLWRHRAALLARPVANALAELLAEDALALPALLDRPVLHASLPTLWRTLDAPAAREVLRAIGSATGWHNAITSALTPPTSEHRAGKRSRVWQPRRHTAAEPPPNARRDNEALTPRPTGAPLHDSLFRAATPLPRDLPASDPRIVLQALLALWQHAPATLSGANADDTLRATTENFAGTAPVTAPTTGTPRGIEAAHPRDDAERAPAQQDAAAAPSSANDTAQAPPPLRPAANASPRPTPVDDAPPHASPTSSRVSSVAASPATLPPAAEHDFRTRGGGFFFLLNVLNLPALRDWRATLSSPQPGTVRAEPVEAHATALRQACTEQSRRAQGERGNSIASLIVEAQAGWRELVRLARWLDFTPDAPLAAFLATACALETPDDPATALAALPPGADPAPVHHAAQRYYGDAALAAALAERPAHIRATASHLDVHLRLADVQLDIRRTGLDLDPGWLPWLGRVVRFHYDSGDFAR